MLELSDHDLIDSFVREGSQAAFEQIVERHIHLVYSAARRIVRDTLLVEDVSQEVFALLARKAARLGKGTILSAWLYRATRYLAFAAFRRESRRQRGEQLAAESIDPPFKRAGMARNRAAARCGDGRPSSR